MLARADSQQGTEEGIAFDPAAQLAVDAHLCGLPRLVDELHDLALAQVAKRALNPASWGRSACIAAGL
jgi:hypothetical protein